MTPHERLFDLGGSDEAIYFSPTSLGGADFVVLGAAAKLVGGALGLPVTLEKFDAVHCSFEALACRVPQHQMAVYMPKLVRSTDRFVAVIEDFHVLEKYNRILNRYVTVVSNADLDAMVHLPRSNSIKTAPNPNRVGILDAYVATI